MVGTPPRPPSFCHVHAVLLSGVLHAHRTASTACLQGRVSSRNPGRMGAGELVTLQSPEPTWNAHKRITTAIAVKRMRGGACG